VLELTFVLRGIEVAFRFCDESVVVDLHRFSFSFAGSISRKL
jgi:hypothetical protein